MKKLIYIVGLIAIILVAALLIFKFVIPNETQREILEGTGLDDTIVSETSKEAFIDHDLIDSRPNILGNKWIIKILMYNNNESIVINQVKIKYYFTDGNETRTYNVDLRPARLLPAYINDKISGHKNEELIRYEIIDAQ